MSTKKSRKPLNDLDDLAKNFVFGITAPTPPPLAPTEPIPEEIEENSVVEDIEAEEVEAEEVEAEDSTLEFPIEPLSEPLPPSVMNKSSNNGSKSLRQSKAVKPTVAKSSLVSKLMESPDKEATIRLTVDLPESMHRKLSILSARSGKKKAVIVRMLLDEALEDVDD